MHFCLPLRSTVDVDKLLLYNINCCECTHIILHCVAMLVCGCMTILQENVVTWKISWIPFHETPSYEIQNIIFLKSCAVIMPKTFTCSISYWKVSSNFVLIAYVVSFVPNANITKLESSVSSSSQQLALLLAAIEFWN